MKILIAGCGKVGQALAQELCAEGHDLTLIDSRSQVLNSCVERFDVMALHGNCATMNVLRQAGVEKADLLIACTGSDELNLLCSMTAHGINPDLHTIARIRDPEYIEQAHTMRDIFALSLTFNPEQEAATEMTRLLLYPGFFKRDSFAKGKVEIVELRVDAESKLNNLPLRSLNNAVKCRVLVCAVLREGEVVTPGGNFVLREGDRIFVTAPSDSLATLLKNLGIVTRKVKRVMIAGGGTISYYLAQLLHKNHMDVQIIESDPGRCVDLASRLPFATVIQGDAGDHGVLESDGISSCDALVSLTGMDELNMLISLYANSRKIPQIITKLGRLENSKIANSLPLGSVISPGKLSCNNVVRYVRAMQNQSGAAVTIHSIAGGNAEAIEFLVDEHTLHCGEPLKQLKLRKNVLLVSITRGEEIMIPNGDSRFYQGDSVVVVVSGDTVVRQLNEIFE